MPFERKPVHDGILQNRRTVNRVPKLAKPGTWEYDPATSLISYDEQCWEILGLTVDRAVSAEEVFNLVHQEDREQVRKQVRESLSRQGTGLYTIEYRNLRPDGAVNWVVVYAMPGGKPTGNPPRFIGTITDITNQKQAEQAIRKALNQLERRLQEQRSPESKLYRPLREKHKSALPNNHIVCC